MGMLNQYLGNVYLVDWNARIRWAGIGFALKEGQMTSKDGRSTPDEAQGLRHCAQLLLKRLKSGEDG